MTKKTALRKVLPVLLVPIIFSLLSCSNVPSYSANTNSDKPVQAETASKQSLPTQLTTSEVKAYRRVHGDRQMRTLTLSNGLHVLLISDPHAVKASAAMDVGVGTLKSPKKYLGLAHYLEHMLFLGTKKYPGANDYSRYLSQNGGYSNAFTAEEHTNFYFQVNTQAFDGALDRFAQFFISPTFNEKRIPTEMKNVNSEYLKNIQQTGWRQEYLEQILSAPNHPLQNDFQGNKQTLGHVPRQVLIDFYHKYYSANQMNLAVISSLDLDKMQKLVENDFSTIKNNHRPPLNISKEVVLPSQLPRLVKFHAANHGETLTLSFFGPSAMHDWNSDPLGLLSGLINYAGPGSLIANLKNRGLIYDLSSGDNTRHYASEFDIQTSLTPKGYRDYKQVVAAIFSYIDEIRKRGLPRYFFTDTQKTLKLSYIYGSSPTGGHGASTYAQLMAQVGSHDIDSKAFLLESYNKALFDKYLDLIKPDNMTAYLSSSKIKGTTAARFYQFKYTVKQLANSAWLIKLDHVVPGDGILPPPNKYIPQDLSVLDQSGQKPRKLIQNKFGSMWIAPSHFKSPRATITLSLLKPKTPNTRYNVALNALYNLVVNDEISEWGYQASQAGMSVSFDSGLRKTVISCSGYSDHLVLFCQDFLRTLTPLKISTSQFKRNVQAAEQISKDVATKTSFRRAYNLFQTMVSSDSMDIREWAPEIHRVSLSAIEHYASRTISKTKIKAFAYGNITAADAKTLYSSAPHILDARPLPKNETQPRFSEILLPKGKTYSYWDRSKSNNNAWFGGLELGPRTLKTEAIGKLAGVYYSDAFYTEMRTRRTLGYVVYAWSHLSPLTTWLNFMIQSDKGPEYLDKTAMPWNKQWALKASTMPAKAFAAIKSGVIQTLSQKPRSFSEEDARYQAYVFYDNGDFQRRKKLIKAVKDTTQKEFADALTKIFNTRNRRNLNIYVDAGSRSPITKGSQNRITNIESFHSKVNKITAN